MRIENILFAFWMHEAGLWSITPNFGLQFWTPRVSEVFGSGSSYSSNQPKLLGILQASVPESCFYDYLQLRFGTLHCSLRTVNSQRTVFDTSYLKLTNRFITEKISCSNFNIICSFIFQCATFSLSLDVPSSGVTGQTSRKANSSLGYKHESFSSVRTFTHPQIAIKKQFLLAVFLRPKMWSENIS